MNGSDPSVQAPASIGRLLMRFVVVIAVIAAIAFAGILVMLVRNGRSFVRVGTVASLNTDGVLYLPQHKAYVIPSDPTPLALSAVSPADPTVQVTFCEASQTFIARTEAFDRLGRLIQGAGARGMDRVALRIQGDDIYIDPGSRTPGPPRGTDHEPSADPFCRNSG